MIRTITKIGRTSGRVFSALQRSHKASLLIALFIMLITGGLTNVPALVLGWLVDRMVKSTSSTFEEMFPYLGIIIVAILLREALTVARKYLVENTCTRVEKDRLVSLVSHMLKLPMDYYSSVQVGSLNGKLQRSLEGLIRIIKLLFLDFFPTAITAIVAVSIAIVKLPLLGGIMVLAIPVGFALVLWQITSQEGIRIALLRDKEAIDGKVVELLSGIESVRAANTETHETGRVNKLAEQLRQKEIRHHTSMALFDWKYLNEGVFHILVIGTSVFLATKGTITTGDVLTYSLLFFSAITPLREIHRVLDEAHESSLRVHDLFEMLSLSVDKSFRIHDTNWEMIQLTRGIPTIRVDALSHNYGGNSGQTVLSDVSFDLTRGERIGVAGPSGCGKSTLLKLLLGLIHPDSGMVLLNGVPLGKLSREQIAQQVGYVSQTPFMFSGTIFENVTYGCDAVTMEEVHEACRRACIHDEITRFLGGYNGIVSERGQNLSGGQRQRLAIARVLLHMPPIVLLDEATAALDNINEKEVQSGLEELMQNQTVIVVAHRLTTLRNTDRIIVLDGGRIVETGTYAELLNGNGLFAELEHAVAG
jgi:ATP-binding cassette subfamily B protein